MPNDTSEPWLLHARVEYVATRAGREPPSAFALSCLEIASESDALALIDLIEELAAKHHAKNDRFALVADCLDRVFSAISTYRNLRDWHARPKKHFVSQLKSARDKDLNKLIDRSLANPTNAQEVLVAIYSGAQVAGVIESRRIGRVVEVRVVVPNDQPNWVRGDLAWLAELRRHPPLLRRAIAAIPNPKIRQHSTKSIVRRMRELSQNPTRQRLES